MKDNYTTDILIRLIVLASAIVIGGLWNYQLKQRKFLKDLNENVQSPKKFQRLESHNGLSIWVITFYSSAVISIVFAYWYRLNGCFLTVMFYVISTICFQLMAFYPNLLYIRILNKIKFHQDRLIFSGKRSLWYYKLHKSKIGDEIANSFNQKISSDYNKLSDSSSDKELTFKIDDIVDSIDRGRHLEAFETMRNENYFKIKIFIFFVTIVASFMLYICFHFTDQLVQIKPGNGNISYYDFVMYFLSLGQSGLEPANEYTESILSLCWISFLFTFAFLLTNFKNFMDIRFNSITRQVNLLYLHHRDILIQLKFDVENDLVKTRINEWKLKLHSDMNGNAAILLNKLCN